MHSVANLLRKALKMICLPHVLQREVCRALGREVIF